jgi:large subunit ribosomal protein L18
VYAQIIDDEAGKTLASADSRKETKGTGVEKAILVGGAIAKAAKEAKVETVVFDRGGFQYVGIVKALAEGAREGGLKF